MKISDYTHIFDGKIISDGYFETLEYCTSDCKVSFISFLADRKFIDRLNLNISCIITTKEIAGSLPGSIHGIVITEDPKREFVKLHNYLANNSEYAGKTAETFIGENCDIHSTAVIEPQNVIVGNNVHIGANTVIKANVIIHDNVIIHENCVIGGKSFNFVKTVDGDMLRMTDCGKVIIEEGVEICAMSHVAGAPLPSDTTRLKRDCKLDAMVHVGHGTTVGERAELPAGAQVAGNCVIGDDAWIGVNATVANRIKIGNGGRVSLGAVVTKNVAENQTVTGNFAVEHCRFVEELREANRRHKCRCEYGGEGYKFLLKSVINCFSHKEVA